MNFPEAIECPYLRGASVDDYKHSTVYAVEGQAGLWRQVPREGRQGITAPEGRVVAHVGGERLVELVPWQDAVDWLSLRAGLEVVPCDAEGEPISE